MTRGYVLTPLARIDLSQIWDYTADRWSLNQADIYLRALQATIEHLAADPRRGRPCDDIRPGYFAAPSGSHLVFYRPIASGIEIVRILHRRMDLDSHL